MKKKHRVFSFLDVIIIVIIVSFIMCFLGASLIYKHLGGVNFSLLGEDTGLQELIAAYNNLLDNYYDEIDTQDLIDGAIAGMYEVTGDPYTTYLDESSSSSLEESLYGKYQGIGIEVTQTTDGKMQLTKVFEDTPAEEVGLLVGDIIIKVDDTTVTSDNQDELIDNIKNNDSVVLTILRDGIESSVTVSSTAILKPVVEYKILDSNGIKVGYINLSVFSDTADIQFSNALTKLENSGISSLIIDVRNNSGGYLQVAENISEMFLEKNKVIYSLESKDSIEETKDDTSEKRDYKIVVLINGQSASASEILASALKYSYGATLVGTNSYGKGKVQERTKLSNGTELKYTTAKWLTPIGTCIDGVGLTPDITVDLVSDGYDSNNIYTDTQVSKALESLVG